MTDDSASGSASAPRRAINPRAKVSAKGWLAEMVRTLGARSGRKVCQKFFGFAHGVGRSDMHPHAVEPQAE